MLVYQPKDVEKAIDQLAENPIGSLVILLLVGILSVYVCGAFIGVMDGAVDREAKACEVRVCRIVFTYPAGYAVGRWLFER
jgi:hypothetical protein